MRQTDRQTAGKLYRLTAPWVVVFAFSIFFAAGPVIAQSGSSPAELRRENDRLHERIAELEAALIESQRRIEILETQIDALTNLPGDLPADTPATEPEPADSTDRPIPKEASSCPDSLYDSLVDNYNVAFPDLELPPYRDVQNWIRRVSRDRQQVTWLVHVLDTTVDPDRSSSARVNLVDPNSGEAICNDFTFPVQRAQAERIENATDVQLWKFTGAFAANPIADLSRTTFANDALPRLIGPYAVFGWTFDVQSIEPAQQADNPEKSKPRR